MWAVKDDAISSVFLGQYAHFMIRKEFNFQLSHTNEVAVNHNITRQDEEQMVTKGSLFCAC